MFNAIEDMEKPMARDPDDLSTLEQRILLALIRLQPNGYGVAIQDEIAERAGKTVSFGSIYASLDRLEERGFVNSREGEATPERGGRKKVYFTVSGLGRRALDSSLNATDSLRVGIFEGALS
ncbi:helix-turn-helix transcriptional regulator [Methylobacterium sp. Leaf91]|uniref:PadR family transcriptional regulator n=1 Tax=Methylobacterium sp. Leaf91 TaxID=1736247 RepID=UPI001FCDC4D5|nr:helix-turn-helix transcriptional regulator [Methylobacterium sp. Leaf91]